MTLDEKEMGRFNAAIINKMHDQLGEMIVRFRDNPPASMSTSLREKTMRDMTAQHAALSMAFVTMCEKFGESPEANDFIKQA